MSLWAQNKLMPVFLLPNPGKLIQKFSKNFNFSSGDSDRFSGICQSTNRKIEITEKYLDDFSRICQ